MNNNGERIVTFLCSHGVRSNYDEVLGVVCVETREGRVMLKYMDEAIAWLNCSLPPAMGLDRRIADARITRDSAHILRAAHEDDRRAIRRSSKVRPERKEVYVQVKRAGFGLDQDELDALTVECTTVWARRRELI